MHPSELIGTWRFERAISDRSSSTDYAVSGEAEFTDCPDGRVRWSEHGTLTWSGGSTPVERTLYLVACADAWTVTFDDGRAFHPWTPGAVAHWCSPDDYSGHLSEPADPTDAWSLTWTVTGPHKDYTMTTTYRRLMPSTRQPG